MRILFRSLPAYGHLYPLMPLALAARAAGHDVVFSTAGDFIPHLEALGFRTFSAGVTIEQSRFDRFGPNPPLTAIAGATQWAVIGEMFAQAAMDTADDLIPLLPEIDPDVVIYEQTDTGAAIAAAVAGIPAVCHSIVRAMPPDVHDQFVGAPTKSLQSRYCIGDAVDLAHPELVIDTYPPSLQLPSATANPGRIPMRPVAFGEPTATVPPWIGSHAGSLIYVTVGTVAGYTGTLRMVIDGLAELDDVDVLVATGPLDPAALGTLPPRFHAERFVNFAELLPVVDLMVHHGGCGTTTGAWAHGIPQLVWPHGADHYFNAGAVGASGSGLTLEAPTPDHVAKFASALLVDPTYREEARRIGDEIASMPSPTEVLPEVLRRVQ